MEQQNKPIAIMEFKAVSSADSIRFFKKQLDADYKKLFNFTDRKYNCAIERYLILCVNLPDNKIEDNYKNVVKYSRQINIFWDSYSTFKKRLIIINTTLKDILPKNLQKNMHRSIIKIGKYYKVPIRLVVYIIGPF
jgi:hypothetical protein